MAKAAHEIFKLESGDGGMGRPVIIRFCGTSPGKTLLTVLVKSV